MLVEVFEIVKEQGVEFYIGDILFLCIGYVVVYKKLDDEKCKDVVSVKEWCGFVQSREIIEWLWERQFVVVVSDFFGFEVRCEYLLW